MFISSASFVVWKMNIRAGNSGSAFGAMPLRFERRTPSLHHGTRGRCGMRWDDDQDGLAGARFFDGRFDDLLVSLDLHSQSRHG